MRRKLRKYRTQNKTRPRKKTRRTKRPRTKRKGRKKRKKRKRTRRRTKRSPPDQSFFFRDSRPPARVPNCHVQGLIPVQIGKFSPVTSARSNEIEQRRWQSPPLTRFLLQDVSP